jgi:anaerobic magnesium-protoporphyrin IX monomethyl ester cyclase
MGVVYPSPVAFCYPPHTLATVASSLREHGYKVRSFDGVMGALPSTLADADYILVFVSYASLDADLAFIRGLREQTAARLLAFGPAMRFVGEQVLNGAPVDAVLIGEAEGFCAAALHYLEGQTGSREPQSLTPQKLQSSCPAHPANPAARSSGDGTWSIDCDAEGLVCDLDALPFPAWDLLPYERYELLSVFTSRGCPDRCAYCPYAAAQGHHLRTRSEENVLAELSWLSERFRPPRLVFRDPVFAHDRERVMAICEGILRRGLHLSWECESRPEHFDGELLRLMQRAGCQWIKIGLETTDSQLLQRVRRVSSAEEVAAYLQHTADVVQACTNMELQCRVFVMAGLPSQDVLMAQHTRGFLEQLRPTALNVKAFERYPGIDPSIASVTVSPQATAGEVEAQMSILQQTRVVNVEHGSSGLLARGKRWLLSRRRRWLSSRRRR